MKVQTQKNEQITQMLNDWYSEIRARHLGSAHRLKLEIDKKIHSIEEDQNLLLYYSLLDFRYQYLMDSLSISKDSFDKIESFNTPTDNLLAYYYSFFKAIHSNIIGNYNLAKKYYDEAEIRLREIPDQLEHGEFYFKLSTFSCHNQQYVPALKQASKAKEIFSKYTGYELNIGYCNNISGLACTHLKEYELAEEYFISAMDIFQKEKEKQAILYVRHNLGFMYAKQNLSELAIRYLSEVIQKLPNNYKAILIEACEHAKLNNKEKTLELLEKGLKISHELKNEEYQHRFNILLAINNEIPGEKLESIILAGMIYFEKENLYEYIHEYNEILAIKFYHEDDHSKASKYFYLSTKARKKSHNKGALK
ncbi:Rap family tetratricopeptide repeat protein [Bacillus cereus group sp. BfR-BA-01518]|uniref:response regulator aspartate phosphatase n=1 Tax=Bacillus cereus group sp. BfR-BA-01518 TaxID=2920368 RepID=UPI001F5A68FB|nr:Rap family tetratricopeptide repeat protein [Bacillus cereus group sp. BfR-BA-01518]